MWEEDDHIACFGTAEVAVCLRCASSCGRFRSTRRVGLDALRQVMATGATGSTEGSRQHPCRLFRWREIEATTAACGFLTWLLAPLEIRASKPPANPGRFGRHARRRDPLPHRGHTEVTLRCSQQTCSPFGMTQVGSSTCDWACWLRRIAPCSDPTTSGPGEDMSEHPRGLAFPPQPMGTGDDQRSASTPTSTSRGEGASKEALTGLPTIIRGATDRAPSRLPLCGAYGGPDRPPRSSAHAKG